ncbi:serine phosphatase RsbU [Leptospira ryugenii]|uniref:Serine phosphatase RsbU n=1 Tax=Leptospira ryugenii TaxID=1917863 RepID=A0A2P2DWH5_9LEPT|nr:SpoIIE family protein phosphatase [Leptospira ryugenii]GBF48972.1 serine phosphatase RsbU [Leptospira ryugenii]
MSPSSLPPLVQRSEEGGFFVTSSPEILDLYHFILSQARRLIQAKAACFYLKNERGNLSRIGQIKDTESISKIAKHVFRTRKSVLLKKGTHLSGDSKPLEDSVVASYIGDEVGEHSLGVIILEGIHHFENFAEQDLELINFFTSNLSALLKDTYYAEGVNQFLSSLATSILLLVDNSNIHNKNSRLEYLLEEIIRVAVLINTSLDLDRLLEMVMNSAKSVFRTEASSLLLLDDKKEFLVFNTVTGDKREEVAKIKVPMGQGIAGSVAITKQPMIINDAQNDPRVFRDVDKASNFITRNILAAPLIVGEEVIGVIEAINTIDRNNFSQSDIDFFLSFSSACAVAIQKTSLINNLNIANIELKQKLSTLESLFELGQAVLEAHDELGLMTRALAILTKELGAEDAGMVILQEGKRTLLQVYSRQKDVVFESFYDPQESSLILKSLETKDPRIGHVAHQEKDSFLGLESFVLRDSFVVLPVSPSGSSLKAALYVCGKKEPNGFLDSDLRMFKTISSPLAKAYENLRLNQEIITKKSIEKEIEITRNIQNNILPNHLITSFSFDLGVKSVPAKEVSGDFYDFHQYGTHNFSFLVADVSGKSLPAAIFMAMSSSIIRTLSRTTELSPSELLKKANQLIYEDSQSGMFVTLFFANFDSLSRTIRFASAGHNDQIWIRADGTYELLKGKGAPLGVVPIGSYIGGEIEIQANDMLVFYTDGAIEEKNKLEEEFGLDRLIQEIIRRKDKPSQVIVEEIYRIIRNFSDESEQYDDFTVMILKFPDLLLEEYKETFQATSAEIPRVRDFVAEKIRDRVKREFAFDDILVSLDEAATNIVMHGYEGLSVENPTFECKIQIQGELAIFTLIDEAKPFQRSVVPSPSLEANLKGERRGGFGVYLMEKLMDHVSYHNDGLKNYTRLEKRIL